MSFDNVFEFSKQLWFNVSTQVDDWSGQAVVLKIHSISTVRAKMTMWELGPMFVIDVTQI